MIKPDLARFESDNLKKFKIVHVDVDKKDTPEFKQHIQLLMDGSQGGIPYTLILDDKGNKVVDWVGAVPYDKLTADAKPRLDALK